MSIASQASVRRTAATDDSFHAWHSRPSAPLPFRLPEQPAFAFATLSDDSRMAGLMEALQTVGAHLGISIDAREIPSDIARAGTVGRIGVAPRAIATMLRQKIVIGSRHSADSLAPVARLWRGLQRRADVLVDMQRHHSLPGSAAMQSGVECDVLLLSQRITARGAARRALRLENEAADQWTRARISAELAFSIAAAENRTLLLVLPVGRATAAQQYFTDAIERQARLHRRPSPSTVKAGLLTALLTGERQRERFLVASVMPIQDLSATAAEALGDTGPWPVVSLGRDALFYDVPRGADGEADPVSILLVLHGWLQRSGRVELAHELFQSICVTAAALMRMREELGAPLCVPAAAFVRGVVTNWGRAPIAPLPRERRAVVPARNVIAGLRLQIETTLTPGAARDALTKALFPSGLEVASVRSVDAGSELAGSIDVRLRSRLGEAPLGDDSARALLRALGPGLRCLSVEPWTPGSSGERARRRIA